MILGFVEHESGVPEETSLEMLTMARELATDEEAVLCAVVFGDEGAALKDELGPYGIEEIHHVTHDRLEGYAPEGWGESVAQLVSDLGASTVAAAGTDRGHEVLAHAGATLDAPMATNCVDVTGAGESYEVRRDRWGGSLVEHARLEGETKLVTAAEHEYPIEEAASTTEPTVNEFTPSLEDAHLRVRVERVETADEEGIPLGEARVVVGGGRGVGGPEDYDKLEELADLLGGTVGASRAAINEGWRPHDDQIGLTGAQISPDIYIACGISGAVQHMVGCKGADKILAINTDSEAAIVQKADYAVIGDLHEVVPELTDAIREVT
ncbi:electron transfer flavoprotein subunit alpha/FixB family protein [Halostagnicola sp. A-GB9-2]|uniref:electron transfer flavoprotein subunit alpha/FixB family protein n=1 Tax=Halostagnicola sp. A-GB9-2 TaxID=3048066 RepID=UPI0024BFC5FB|nr:electron transfer flavoprotein subunit alpha/FixB family protein [Halostagnicola sp. A-GB9-2]MDJ1434692.1 electron transfer flavoprotein subunit alpha/FixB family protein [Halostagnicola sp. A-GB9-2]